MKRLIKSRNLIVMALAAVAVLFSGCNEDSELGLEILPVEDQINVKNIELKDGIASYTFTEDSINTSGSGKRLLGSFNDPVFGKTTIDYATQFRMQFFPDFGVNPVVDSINLYLYYRILYGDTLSTQKFSVYELEESLSIDEVYFNDIDLKSMASGKLLGEVEYKPRVRLDSITKDTFYQLITIPLDISLGEKLLYADSLDMVNNDVFTDFFKGLYIETEEIAGEGGTILTLEDLSSQSFRGSALLLYYNNDSNKQLTEEPDTLINPYLISNYSARVNRIEHDYTGTSFATHLNQEEVQDKHIYVQPTGGLNSRILVEALTGWKDSVNIGINKAELVFHVDTIASDIHNFPPPNRLYFTFVDVNQQERFPVDYYFNPNFYGGLLNDEDYTYRFNITQHLQRVIEVNDPEDQNYVGNQGFFLTTGRRGDIANRVVLHGAESDTGIELVVTYSKFIQ